MFGLVCPGDTRLPLGATISPGSGAQRGAGTSVDGQEVPSRPAGEPRTLLCPHLRGVHGFKEKENHSIRPLGGL